ncbi:MAG: YeeE/YedE family protein [Candidatus Nitrohelix vancouverensis]|uniref:YeeE/YedE family protein n=1 Tax=Candidatus Nitrohelix vancouverensis TaxID=2705534 RepID=A0A7T0C303_9BACT|nr:MAG: YeeE/YedE family protein [Candidatus Nitrohelix vancouverensis]
MISIFRQQRWSPYAVGAGLGVLSWLTFVFMDKALGVSTTLVRLAGGLESVFARDRVHANTYFAKYLGTVETPLPVVDWQFALVAMIFLGAFVSAKLSGQQGGEKLSAIWQDRFGPSAAKRYLGAFAGGVILIMGARLAGGCTSGHAVSGGMQLAVSSWAFTIAMFASGVVVAILMFKRR